MRRNKALDGRRRKARRLSWLCLKSDMHIQGVFSSNYLLIMKLEKNHKNINYHLSFDLALNRGGFSLCL